MSIRIFLLESPYSGKYISDELPKIVEAVQAGWLATFQGAATVVRASLPSTIQTVINTILIQSTLLCGIDAGLLVFFKDETNFGANGTSCRCNGPEWNQPPRQKFILTLTYLSLVLSLGVAVMSYALTVEFSTLPVRAAKNPLHTNGPANIMQGSNWFILRNYCLKGHIRFIWIYCRISIYLATRTLTRRLQGLSPSYYR